MQIEESITKRKSKLCISLPISQSFYSNIFTVNSCKKETKNKFLQVNQEEIQKATNNNLIYKNRWTKEEDDLLLKIIKKVGARRWNQIAMIIKTKTGKQCRDHYANCLDPKINNTLWTQEEEQILLLKYKEYGNHWAKIKKYLPGRTTLMIKNYINVLLKKNVHNIQKINSDDNENKDDYIDSENEQNDEYFNSYSNKIQMQSNDFTIYDINYLLNRPITAGNI